MKFAKLVFLIAGVYGVLALVPMYFWKPPADRPEFFYGFIGVALAWQVLFFVISRNPGRFRMAMLPAILEKLAFGIPAIILYAQGRLTVDLLAAGIIDLVLATLFFFAWRKTA